MEDSITGKSHSSSQPLAGSSSSSTSASSLYRLPSFSRPPRSVQPASLPAASHSITGVQPVPIAGPSRRPAGSYDDASLAGGRKLSQPGEYRDKGKGKAQEAADAGYSPSKVRPRASPSLFKTRVPSGDPVRVQRSSPENSSLSPRLSRRLSKGQGPDRPPYLREVGSATIHLRQNAVEKLSDDDAPSPILAFRPASASASAAADTSKRIPSAGGTKGLLDVNVGGVARDNSTRKTPAPAISPLALGTSSRAKVSLPPPSFVPAPSPNRRPRSSSIHYPSRPVVPPSTGESYFLPHFSLDREYSLKPELSPSRRVNLNLELGLGGDFDASFGEAMRNGTAGKEMQLPPQALRALSEARVNLDERVSSKQGRKGSITMGLFKESRAQSKQRSGERDQVPLGMLSPSGAVEEAISEEEDEARGVDDVPSVEERLVKPQRERARTGGSVEGASSDQRRGGPTHDRTSSRRPSGEIKVRPPAVHRDDTYRISSPSKSDRYPAPQADHFDSGSDYADETPRVDIRPSYISRLQEEAHSRHDSGQSSTHSMSFDSESGWTTTSEESEDSSMPSLGTGARRRLQSRSQSDAHGSQMYGQDGGDESATDMSDEEEPMTVPLQPFGHAVGGHSSIYQFTRRAVCKVSTTLVGKARHSFGS